MKRIITLLTLISFNSMVHAAYENGGFISSDAYVYEDIECSSGQLVVKGGGAALINMLNSANLEIQSTNSPLKLDEGGVWDIVLYSQSHLDFYDGLSHGLTMRQNSTADIYGGQLDWIIGFQNAIWQKNEPTGHVNIYTQPGWSWIMNGQQKVGISGLWRDNSSFYIRFQNDVNYDPVWNNINIIVPEPVTILLFGIGSLLVLRKHSI